MPVYRQLIIKYGTDLTDAMVGIERINRAVDGSAKAFDQKFGSVKDKMNGVGVGLSVAVTAPLLLMGRAAIDANMRFDSLRRGMAAVTGSTGLAANEFERLKEVAKLPGLGFEEALSGSISLQAAGMNADMAARSLMAFGNALATVGKGKDALDGVNIALVQLMNRSSGFGQEIRQLQNWLPQIRQAMKGAFGTSDSEEIAKSGISGAQFVTAITAELEKLPKMTGGVRNAFENMSDASNRALAAMGNAAEGPVMQIAGTIENLATSFTNLDKADQRLIVGIGVFAAVLGPAILAGVKLWETVVTIRGMTELLTAAKIKESSAIGANTATVVANAEATTVATAANRGFAASAALALAPYALVAVIGVAIYSIYKNWSLVNESLESQNNTIDDLNTRLDEYEKRLERLGKLSPQNTNPREKLQAEVNKWQASEDTQSAAVNNNEWHKGQQNFERNKQKKERGGFWSRLAAEAGSGVKSAVDLGFRGSGGGDDYDLAVDQRDENRAKLKKAQDALKKFDSESASSAATAAITNPLEDNTNKWKLAAIQAAQKGDEAGEAWANIESSYAKKLADSAAAKLKDSSFDQVYADMIAKEEYKADKAKIFRERSAEAGKKREEAIKQAADDKKKREEAIAEAFRNRRAEDFAYIDQKQMQAASKREKYEAAIQDEKDPSKRAKMGKEMAAANYEVAAIDAMKAYATELDNLNEAKAKGIDVTERMAAAQMKYRNSMESAVRDSLKMQISETQGALDMTQTKIDAYKAEGEAYKERALGQLGFSTFRSRWQQDMIAGQKERFREGAKQSDPGEKQVQELVKLNKDLTQQLSEVKELLRGAVTVNA